MLNHSSRVFVTGFGAITPGGATLEATWASILAGQVCTHESKQYDLSTWSHKISGCIDDVALTSLLPDKKLSKVISRQDAFGIHAAIQAVEHSQCLTYRDGLSVDAQIEFNEKTGVFVGSPGNKYYQQYDFLPLIAKSGDNMHAFASDLMNEVHPMWLLRILPNNVLAYTGITCGFKGINHNITNHAVGGMQAIIEGYHAIAMGQAERVVVVAYDVGAEPQALYYYQHLGLISPTAVKPFDASHDGTILSEGACAMVLESEASARARGAMCHAEILGGVSQSEMSGLYSIEEDGHALSLLMKRLLDEKKKPASNLDFVVAHGNGSKKSDVSEALAIERVFAGCNVPVTAFKWSMGHTLTASGVLDGVLSIQAMKQGCLPGIANLTQVATDCAVLNVSQKTREFNAQKSSCMVINRGFAGMNACLLLSSCEPIL